MVTGKIRIPFHLCDPAQILFFGSLFDVYHLFLEENLESFGLTWKDWFKGEAAAPIKALKAEYDAPLFYGETYNVQWRLLKITDSTTTFSFEILNDGKRHAWAEVTHCFMDKDKRKKTAVPKKIREALEAAETSSRS